MDLVYSVTGKYTSVDIHHDGAFVTSFVLPTPLWWKLRTVLQAGALEPASNLRLINSEDHTDAPRTT